MAIGLPARTMQEHCHTLVVKPIASPYSPRSELLRSRLSSIRRTRCLGCRGPILHVVLHSDSRYRENMPLPINWKMYAWPCHLPRDRPGAEGVGNGFQFCGDGTGEGATRGIMRTPSHQQPSPPLEWLVSYSPWVWAENRGMRGAEARIPRRAPGQLLHR